MNRSPSHTLTRRAWLRSAALGTLGLATLAGCQSGGVSVLGYQFGADKVYDTSLRTVYVPQFYNRAFQTTPYRGLEVELTKAVVREIQLKTPYRIVSDPERADTELLGNVVSIDKFILNRNQQNTIREGDIQISVDVVWRDLRDGRVLSNPRRPNPLLEPPPGTPGSDIPQFDPDVPVPPPVGEIPVPVPVRITATGRLIPELGESNLTAEHMAVNRIAIQIVSMMEKGW